jgi:DUF177 domain-containing protein
MQLNVLSQLRQSIGSVATLSLDEPIVRLDEVTLRCLNGSLTLLRTDRGLLASFEGTSYVREGCARCLAETDCQVDIRFIEEFVPVTDANTGAGISIEEDEDTYRIGPAFVLDLRDALREYLLIAEPLKPLCRPDCAGLCPTCGSNLNDGACSCAPAVDKRWGALAGFEKNASKGP